MLNQEQIKEIIPHRYEMLLLDEVIELEVGKRCVATKTVTEEDFFFRGHFPGNPVMPGVLQVEAMAQAGAVAILSTEEFKGKTAYFGGIDKVRFKGMVKPGDTITLVVEITKVKGLVGKGEGKCLVNGKVMTKGEITFAIK
jgi:3-hydroxyacyl-[acyl-carrier-protein] dehydratase